MRQKHVKLSEEALARKAAADAAAKESGSFIRVDDLTVHYELDDSVVEAVNGVSFEIRKGEVFGLIGETGAGKTTVALSLMRLLPVPPSNIIKGNIYMNGENIFDKSDDEMRRIRGGHISMIFQDPMTALNPVQRVGDQIAECIALHSDKDKKADAELEAIKMLNTVGIPSERYKDYPHQFSGGMKQRVVIAMALSCKPDLIIADEPTTALDVTIQAQVLALMKNLQTELNTSMLIITHDFGVVAEMCDKCAVMYAGEIVEYGTVKHFFENPMHPYTIGLFDSLPSAGDGKTLKPIRGLMPDPTALPTHCTFAERCDKCTDRCMRDDPVLIEVEPGHFVKCFRQYTDNK